MAEVNGEILIERPVEEVFDFVANQENEAPIQPADAGRVEDHRRADRRWNVVSRRDDGERSGSPHDDPGDRVRAAPPDSGARGDAVDGPHGGLDFEPAENGTRMRWHWDLRPNGALRFMGPLVASMGRRQERRIWTGLKRLLESRLAP